MSYRVRDEHRDPAAELNRLRAQVDLSWAAELRHLRLLGVEGHESVLETGCGPGYVLERWRQAFPDAALTGLDLDNDLLQLGRSGPVGAAVQWVRGDATRMPFPGARFDLVLARFLWQHLRDPAAAATEARRVLRPGGRIVVVDVDAELWGVAHPVFPEVIPIHVKHGRAQARRGGNRRIGRHLHRLLEDAGFQDVHLDVIAVSSDDVGLEPFLPQLDPDRQLIARRQGAVTETELEVLRSAHRRFVADPDAYVLMTHFVASGTVPTPG
ncbi:MAG TPA: methyltransferase domain-containing protein [Longimicrobiales bacterium]|nr:methyltransferase domain-containing protein [Longimicrobiales bacterium]